MNLLWSMALKIKEWNKAFHSGNYTIICQSYKTTMSSMSNWPENMEKKDNEGRKWRKHNL